MRVRSAVDLWYVALVGMTALALLGSVVVLPADARLGGLAGAGPVLAFLLWLTFATSYELRDDDLYCRSGPFSERIPYERIRSVTLTENLWSSMALSRRRIEIRQHGKGWIRGTTYISPVNRVTFAEALRERCPNLE